MNNTKKTAIILVNVGTPDAPKLGAVRNYLTQFLNDKRVIDIPLIPRKLLVNGIIIPFRAKNSTKLYQKLFTEEGSPLLIYLNGLVHKLSKKYGEHTDVFGAMRYGNPPLKKTLANLKNKNYDNIVIVPLFPQYASSTSGTINEFVMKEMAQWNNIPNTEFVGQFYDHPAFIKSFARRIKEYKPESYDHILFSYHGLPTRQLDRVHPEHREASCKCHESFPTHGKLCYKATCYQTTRLLAQELELKPDSYSVAFQSRLSKNWLTPFSDKVIEEKAKKGIKKILVVAPAFVADCLETTIEIQDEYEELFIEQGGQELKLVESLNDTDEWVDALFEIISEKP